MYFLNDVHQMNYKRLSRRFQNDSLEYETAYYIVAIPEIYSNIQESELIVFPFLWAYRHSVEDSDVQYEFDIDGTIQMSDTYYKLLRSYQRLVDVGIYLYSGSPSSFLDGLMGWSEELLQVFIQALLLRKGYSYQVLEPLKNK